MAYEIIIAEDDPVLREVYVRKFKDSDYHIHTAANGEEALALIEEVKPQLVLLDINMPIMDGFAVLEKIPAEKRPFKVIMLTNFEDQQNRRRGEELKVDDYFVKKNMTIKSLYEMVEGLLQGVAPAS